MSTAEIFLMIWAGVATLLAVMFREDSRKVKAHHICLAGLLAEVVTGEVVPKKEGDMWIVENDDVKMAFKRSE